MTQQRKIGPAADFSHDHAVLDEADPPEAEPRLSFGQRLADLVAAVVGSWPFIIAQTLLLAAWIALNVWLVHHRGDAAFDPYPFILLNLVLSFQAAYTGPVVMMSQNRQAEKDRQTAQHDLKVDRLAEREIRVLMEHLVHQDHLIHDLLDEVRALRAAQVASSEAGAALVERVDAATPPIQGA